MKPEPHPLEPHPLYQDVGFDAPLDAIGEGVEGKVTPLPQTMEEGSSQGDDVGDENCEIVGENEEIMADGEAVLQAGTCPLGFDSSPAAKPGTPTPSIDIFQATVGNDRDEVEIFVEAGKGVGTGTSIVLSPEQEQSESTTISTAEDSSSNPMLDSSSNYNITVDNSISQKSHSPDLSSHQSDHSPALLSPSPPLSCPMESSMDTGVRRSPVSARTSPSDQKSIPRTQSSVSRSPNIRPQTPQTPVHRPSSEFVVLQPLSPDHGLELNQQYEFLRRTLSHSQRRFSQRGRHPKVRRGQGEGGGRVSNHRNASAGTGLGESGLVQGLVSPRPAARRDIISKEARQKQAIGQLKSIMLNGENNRDPHEGDEGEDLEEHVDQHGRTYYMDHVTRTIAFDRSVTSTDVIPSQQEMLTRREMQTRREMLDRRCALIYSLF